MTYNPAYHQRRVREHFEGLGMEPALVARLTDPWERWASSRALLVLFYHGIRTLDAAVRWLSESHGSVWFLLPKGMGHVAFTFVQSRLAPPTSDVTAQHDAAAAPAVVP